MNLRANLIGLVAVLVGAIITVVALDAKTSGDGVVIGGVCVGLYVLGWFVGGVDEAHRRRYKSPESP